MILQVPSKFLEAWGWKWQSHRMEGTWVFPFPTMSLNCCLEVRHPKRYAHIEIWKTKQNSFPPCYAAEALGSSCHPANRAAISPRLSVFPFLFSFWLKKLSLYLLVTYLSPILAFCLSFSFLSWCLTCLWPAWFLSISRHLLLHLSYSSISLRL